MLKQIKIAVWVGFLFSCGNHDENNDSKTLVHNQSDYSVTYDFSENIIKRRSAGKDFHAAAWQFSNMGAYFEALESFDHIEGSGGAEGIYCDTSNFKAFAAIDYIVEKAKEAQIVIINEAHHISYHRFFSMLLLEKLRNIGYTFFGAETLSHGDSLLNKRGYPILQSGFYTTEPQYGNLIRKAINSGYVVFPYETRGGLDGKLREIEQARNIERILQIDPKAKILIHCGYGHLMEGPVEGWGKAMAGRVAEYTGIDPLTIDQVELTEHSDKKFENPYYRCLSYSDFKVLTSGTGVIPVNFRIDGPPSDIFVYHPRTQLKYNRPSWLFDQYVAKFISKDITIAFPVIVKAYIAGEDEKLAVPIDVVEIKGGDDSTALALIPVNFYKIIIENKMGQLQEIRIRL